MSLQNLEKLIAAKILASRTGEYFWTLLQKTKLLKKRKKERFCQELSIQQLLSKIHLQLVNLCKDNASLSALQY